MNNSYFLFKTYRIFFGIYGKLLNNIISGGMVDRLVRHEYRRNLRSSSRRSQGFPSGRARGSTAAEKEGAAGQENIAAL